MKIVNQAFKHLILVGLIVSTSISESFGQVITRVLSPEDKIENYIPWFNPDEEIPIVNAPFVDVEAALQEDEQEGRLLPRVSIHQEMNISSDEWLVIQRGNFSIWNIALASENAKSMNVRFENTHLPEDAMMFIYNRESRFIVGPISSDNFINGSFRSDYVGGSMVEVSIFVPGHSEPIITISSYDYGIVNTSFNTETFGISKTCNINVACEEGVGWGCQINSVCRIITDRGGNCSGSLVNNDCCDLTPFLLTANHCVDGDLDDYLFAFNWQTPACENGEFAPAEWVTYQGAQVIANWEDTDFSLLELIRDIRPEDGISFSGWDRQDVVPDEVTMIHHPRGDVKKMSFDANPAIENNDIIFTDILGNPAYTIPGDHGFRITMTEFVQGEFGVLEGGSSGCGYFDENGRLVSQHSGGEPDDCEDEFDKWSGRISESWEGNGTPDSRLRDWLGASINPNTMDCMEHPFIDGFDGMDVLCRDEANGEFTLVNNMPCAKNVQWEVSPSHLFSSPTNGTGNSLTLQTTPNARGNATITYTLSSEGCNDAEVEESFWIGPPEDLSFDGIYGDMFICVGATEQYFVLLEDLLEQGVTNYFWSVSPSSKLQILGSHINQNDVFVQALEPGFAQINFHATNRCGTTVSTLDVIISGRNCDGGGGIGFRSSSITSEEPGFKVNIFPNPANDFIEVACSGYTPGTRIAARIISTNGKVVRTLEEYSHNFKVGMGDLPSGLFVLQLNVNGTVYHEKIVKL